MSRILDNVHASAKVLCDAGLLDAVTVREFDALCLPPLHDYTSEDVRRIRAKAKASQAVFAQILNVGTTTVAAWEQGTKKPSGPAVKLLDWWTGKGSMCCLREGPRSADQAGPRIVR
jgi:putative transcriptional regulator